MGRITAEFWGREKTFVCMPGHAGIKGNELTDFLTNTVTIMYSKSMNRADIVTTLKECTCLMLFMFGAQ